VIKSESVQQIDMSADELVSALLGLAATERVCLLDSCGVGHLGSHLLIAGIDPVSTHEISSPQAFETLSIFERQLEQGLAAIFTISYDLGNTSPLSPNSGKTEQDIFLSLFDALVFYDYDSGSARLVGNREKFGAIVNKLRSGALSPQLYNTSFEPATVTSNFTRKQYLGAIEQIQEQIRGGYTYQTNLTQQLTATLPAGLTPEIIFARLRRDHPAPACPSGRCCSTGPK
jgi:anthranilate/para-aminobenzoate synthase component I